MQPPSYYEAYRVNYDWFMLWLKDERRDNPAISDRFLELRRRLRFNG